MSVTPHAAEFRAFESPCNGLSSLVIIVWNSSFLCGTSSSSKQHHHSWPSVPSPFSAPATSAVTFGWTRGMQHTEVCAACTCEHSSAKSGTAPLPVTVLVHRYMLVTVGPLFTCPFQPCVPSTSPHNSLLPPPQPLPGISSASHVGTATPLVCAFFASCFTHWGHAFLQ